MQKVRSKVRSQARLGRQSEASQSSSIMGSRDAGPAYGTKKNLILAGLKPAIFLVPKTDALSIRPQDPACKAKEGSH